MVVVKSWFQRGIKKLSLSFLIALLASVPAWADDQDDSSLVDYLSGMDNVSADFDQTISDVFGRIVEVSSGTVAIQKPRARWETTSPYPQVLLLNDKALEVYDPDLEQVTQRDISEGWEQVPLALLIGDAGDIGQHFTIERELYEEDLAVFTLTPNSPNAVFEFVELTIQKNKLTRITIRDQGAQETVVSLRNYQSDVVLESDLFKLDLPPHTDVIRG
ncbi:MAG: outer membrane lipoprotein chaperone LolA [Pseudomonadales bacterium]|nr:outer membrane lipoprotein chaperone LolA [Pseudomonadales bacterium]